MIFGCAVSLTRAAIVKAAHSVAKVLRGLYHEELWTCSRNLL